MHSNFGDYGSWQPIMVPMESVGSLWPDSPGKVSKNFPLLQPPLSRIIGLLPSSPHHLSHQPCLASFLQGAFLSGSRAPPPPSLLILPPRLPALHLSQHQARGWWRRGQLWGKLQGLGQDRLLSWNVGVLIDSATRQPAHHVPRAQTLRAVSGNPLPV